MSKFYLRFGSKKDSVVIIYFFFSHQLLQPWYILGLLFLFEGCFVAIAIWLNNSRSCYGFFFIFIRLTRNFHLGIYLCQLQPFGLWHPGMGQELNFKLLIAHSARSANIFASECFLLLLGCWSPVFGLIHFDF